MSFRLVKQDRLLLAAVAGTWFLMTLFNANMGYFHSFTEKVRGIDSVYYYAYLPSVFVHGTIDQKEALQEVYGKEGLPWGLTERNRAAAPYAFGPALLVAPVYGLVHGALLAGKFLGLEADVGGFSPAHHAAANAGHWLTGLAALLVMTLWLRRHLEPLAAAAGAGLVLLATSMTYYLWADTLWSHNAELLGVGLFLLMADRHGPGWKSGAAAGLMVLCRWQTVFFVPIYVLCMAFEAWRDGRFTHPEGRRTVCRNLLVFGCAFAVVFMPLPLQIWHVYGSPFINPQGVAGPSALTWSGVWHVWGSLGVGLFSAHPLLLAGLVGLALFARRHRRTAMPLILYFAAQTLVNAYALEGQQAWSFGYRRLVCILPILALGFGWLVQTASPAFRTLLFGLLAAACLWNQLFIFQFRMGLIRRSGTLSWKEHWHDKFRLPSVATGRMLTIEAITALGQGDLPAFVRDADRAWRADPGARGSSRVYLLASVLVGNIHGLEAARALMHQEPDNTLFAVSAAELLRRAGRPAEARQLLLSRPDLTPSRRDRLLALLDGNRPLADEEFHREFKQELRRYRLE